MKQILIITHKLGQNYGGILQAYALQKTLTLLSYRPETTHPPGSTLKRKISEVPIFRRLAEKRPLSDNWSDSTVYTAKFVKKHIHTHSSAMLTSVPKIARKTISYIIKKLTTTNANTLLACSRPAGRFFYRDSSKYKILHNGIKVDKYKFSKKTRSDLRYELGIKPDELVFTNISRLTKEKNYLFLIDIFNHYLKYNNNSRLLIVGDGYMRELIENKIHNLGIKDKVIMTGFRDDTHKIYSAADLLLAPSLNEGLMITLIEAQASGLPAVVSTSVPRDGNISKKVNYLDLSLTAEEWAECISKIDKKRQSENYKVIQSSVYNIEHTASDISNLYNRLYKSKPG